MSNSWTVRITTNPGTNSNGDPTWNPTVVQVNEDGTEKIIQPYDTRSFKKNNQSTRKEVISFIGDACGVASCSLGVVNAAKTAFNECKGCKNKEDNEEEDVPTEEVDTVET